MSHSGKRSGGKRKEDASATKDEDTGPGNGDKSESGTKSDRTSLNDEGSKPGSAGGSVREGSQRLLALAMKGEWPPVDQVLKALEKAVASGGEDVNTAPLAGIADSVTGMTPLMYAVKDNRTTLIDRMIDLGVDVTARNFDNFNALHIASMHSREDVVKLLLAKKGVDVYVTGGAKNQTAVHMVASRQTGTATSILRALLAAAGKEIRLRTDAKGKIPLLLAVESGNQSMCRELLSSQAADQLRATTPDGDSALHLATRRRDLDMVRILVDYGTNVDIQNGEGQTALHIAAAEGDETLVKYFYGVRASASIADNQDRTPMHLAAENGHANIIELLADKFKASIFERTKDGSTLMHIASLNGHAECAMMLFKKGVYLHMPNKDGARSIHTAARYGHIGIINTLLQKGEKVDVTTNDNYTPLHIAVESGKPLVVETLLGYGADVHVRGGDQRETPLHIAARVKDGDRCALMLLKSGAGPNLATDDGQTPVHVAAKYGNTQTLILLLEDGGDPLFKNKVGESPLHLACRGCKRDVVKQLIDFVRETKGPEVSTSYLNSVNEDGASALHYAAKVSKSEVEHPLEDMEVVRLLLENGADSSLMTKQTLETAFHFCSEAGNNDIMTEMISHMQTTDVQKALNRQTSVGWTPLLIACHKGHMELVNNLLANHARVDVFDVEGRSALHLAAERGFLQVCDALLTNKAFINSKSRVGRTALHLAAMNGYTHLVSFLIKDHNATIDVLTLRKQTPLHLAAAAGQLEVCRLLLELGASIDATDDQGQKPIHVAAQNNYSVVVQLFLQQHPSLVMASTKDGNTCAHIAAIQGSVRVIEELMKFDRQGVISARNRLTEATPLQLAAEGGHAEVVKALVRAGASCTEENKAGFTAVHLAAQNGHGQVLEVMRTTQSLRITSKKLGVTALHVAAYFGQADTVRELLSHIPATVKSDSPSGATLVGELGSESGMTPLHLASYSGNENVVRLLLNSAGVQVDAATTENGYNSLHLACFGGHITVVGLLLSRSADLLHSADTHGKTGLHIASTHGHYQMVEVLLGQGAEINATDKNGWTSLHCAARAGYLSVVRLLVESGASPKSETNYGSPAIWFAASEGHNDVLQYLMTKEHDTYSLMEDKRFVYNLMICGKNNKNRPIEEFILVSPAPVDTAAKLSSILVNLATKEKERSKDLLEAGKMCEAMATELLALAAGADSAGRILTALDRRNIEFLDVLIENEQKEVIAHTVVQRYLQELWRGTLNWAAWRTMLLFLSFIVCPPIWIFFTLPLGHSFYKVPIIKFMSYLTSHIYLMLFLMLVGITPIYPVVRATLMPYWYEWTLLVWLSGLLLNELTNPSDKSGLGWIRLAVLLFGIFGVAFHLLGILIARPYWPTLMYLRNQLFALAFLLACVQILDFLSFHHLFGPWAIIIGNLMKDLARFLAVLAIFIFGFSMHIVALNQPFLKGHSKSQPTGLFAEVQMSPFLAFELLFFAVFGQTTPGSLKTNSENQPDWTLVLFKVTGVMLNPVTSFELLFFAVFGQTTADGLRTKYTKQPGWTLILYKLVFGIYMLVSVVVLINLLIAMMSDTYQRIQAQSDIEWKYGLAKLIRNMHRTTTTPSPLNLVTTWLMVFLRFCKQKVMQRKRPSLVQMMGLQSRSRVSPRTKVATKWLAKVKKGQVAPKDSMALSVVHLSPLGSQLSFGNATRIENVADWEAIAKKYRALMGGSGDGSGRREMSLGVSTELITLKENGDQTTRLPSKSLSHLPKRPPVDIEFCDVSYTVPTTKGSKLILRGVSGLFRSGQLTAILGPSGAGKSTLLNILAGYKRAGATGTILINGTSRDMGTFRKLSRYIMQEDLVQPNLTVEESMIISADLKLGNSRTRNEKMTAINEILGMLRLNNCRKTYTTKLSGGERKRLSIALELVNNPPVIFLDEPTTGLDDLSSSQCISLLRMLAEGGRTVVCSVHTPSARLFAMFDHVYLVAQGCCVFQGSGQDIVPFLQTFGLTCPMHYNPADFVIEVASGEYGSYIDKMMAVTENGKVYKWGSPGTDNLDDSQPLSRTSPIQLKKTDYNFSSSGWSQFQILLKRMMLQTLRDSTYLLVKLILYIFVALVVGGMFYGMGNDASKTLFNFGFCFVCLIVLMYVPMLPVLLQFPSEIRLLKREYFNRWYGLTSYFLAMTLSRLPIQIIFSSIYVMIVYILTDQPLDSERCIMFLTVCIITGFISESLGLVLSSFLNVVNGIFMGPALSVPLMLLAVYGLGYGTLQIPLYMRLFMHLSYLRYGLEGLILSIYGGNRANMICPREETYCHYKNPKTIIEIAGMEHANVWVDLAALIVTLFAFRIMSFLVLRFRLSTSKKFTALHRISHFIKSNFDITRKYS